MNIKIKSTGVSCLVGDDYDRVYAALKKELQNSENQIFTERIPGHEYLQWELPGEGWVSLAEGDPLMAQEVQQELLRRKQVILQRFGKNQAMAQKILSVPDDQYVYYKPAADGSLQIRLTAWGYRYPERVGGGGSTGLVDPQLNKESACIHILYDNKPLPNKEFYLNGFKRSTDDSGVYSIGNLPIGYKFTIQVDGQQQIVEIQQGQGNIRIDVTLYVTIEVKATLDGQPYAGAVASLAYWGHVQNLTLDTLGTASVKLPQDPNLGACTISLDGDSQEQVPVQPVTLFCFSLKSPPPVEPEPEMPEVKPEPEVPEVKKEPETPEVKKEPEILAEKEEPEAPAVKEEPETPVVKEEPDPEPEQKEEVQTDLPVEKKANSVPVIWEILLALLLLLLVGLTYFFCKGMLFG